MKYRNWSDSDLEFLKINYPIHGMIYCIAKLNRTRDAIRRKIELLDIKLLTKKVPEKYEYNTFLEIVKNSNSILDIARKLYKLPSYGNRQTVLKFINLYKFDITHFNNNYRGDKTIKITLDKILVENSTYKRNLKDRLYNEGLKTRKCELCGQGEEWRAQKMSLILDHINGINDDNRIENLRIVCPNCNATLPTHCRGSR